MIFFQRRKSKFWHFIVFMFGFYGLVDTLCRPTRLRYHFLRLSFITGVLDIPSVYKVLGYGINRDTYTRGVALLDWTLEYLLARAI